MRSLGAEAGVKKFFENSITENCKKVFKKNICYEVLGSKSLLSN